MPRLASPTSYALADALRARIQKGVFVPGQKLPTHVELEQQFSVSTATVQRVLDQLRTEGFVKSVRRQGTFVTDQPPCLHNFGLVLPIDRTSPYACYEWTRLYDGLLRAAERHNAQTGQVITVYAGVDGEESSEPRVRLMEDLRKRRLAGLILVRDHTLVRELTDSDLPIPPCVKIQPEPAEVPVVGMDMPSLFDRSLSCLAEQGATRIGILGVENLREHHRFVQQALASHHLETRPYWFHMLSHHYPDGVTSCVHLMMHEGQTERPDGLVIADDNLLEPALGGLIAAGVGGRTDIHVVAHSNEHIHTNAMLPIQLLGFNVERVLSTCLELIEQQSRGESVPEVTLLQPLFEQETEDASSQQFTSQQ